MNTDISKADINAGLKKMLMIFLSAVICAVLTDKTREFYETAIIICTCFPLSFGYGKPLLKTVTTGITVGTAAVLICTLIGLCFGNPAAGPQVYSLFCGTLLLCSFGGIMRFMPEKHAARTVSLLFMYIALAGAAA